MKDVVPYCDKKTAQLAANTQHFILSWLSWANMEQLGISLDSEKNSIRQKEIMGYS